MATKMISAIDVRVGDVVRTDSLSVPFREVLDVSLAGTRMDTIDVILLLAPDHIVARRPWNLMEVAR